MTEPNCWVFVFGEIAGLRWVLQHETMAFTESAGRRALAISDGDRAILYVSRGAFHNPTRDHSRLAGEVTVASAVERREPVEIAGREFALMCRIEPEIVLPERQGPQVQPLTPRLERVKRPEVWGQYFRNSPVSISAADFAVLSSAVRNWPTELQEKEVHT